MTPRELAIVALLAGGVFFVFVGAVGIIRLPDLYTRTHATSKSDTLGVVLSLAAAALVFETVEFQLKVVALLLFMLVTTPTATHAIARAAFDQGIEPWTTESDTAGDEQPAGEERVEYTGDDEPATDGGVN
jgi:multicomponent Na+:H+ antiporter subunit G